MLFVNGEWWLAFQEWVLKTSKTSWQEQRERKKATRIMQWRREHEMGVNLALESMGMKKLKYEELKERVKKERENRPPIYFLNFALSNFIYNWTRMRVGAFFSCRKYSTLRTGLSLPLLRSNFYLDCGSASPALTCRTRSTLDTHSIRPRKSLAAFLL